VHFRETAQPQVREILQKLVLALQLTIPDSPSTAGVVVETDALGTLRARYSWTAPGTLRRERVAYTEIPALSQLSLSVAEARQELTGGTTLRLDPRGGLSSLEDAVAIQVRGPDASKAASVSASLSLRF